MEQISNMTLGEIVTHNYKAAAALEKFSLDFCCKGDQTIEEACRAAGTDPALVLAELSRLEETHDSGFDFDSWPLSALADYIVRRHHAYVEQQTPRINRYLDKIGQVHGARHPELLEIRSIFSEVGGELIIHMKKEELMLFPFIKALERAAATNKKAESPLFKSVRFPVEMMKADHAEEGEKFARIAALSGNYSVPEDACNTYAVAYKMLKDYEQDLHLHIHLENNILFPKAISIEATLNHVT